MKYPLDLVFLTAGAEPGADGIGDYVRGIAYQLSKLGYRIGWVAWRDPGVQAADTRVDKGLILLRLPARATELERRERFVAWWHLHRAPVLSWQMAPYGFHPRGLLATQGAWLRRQMGPTACLQLFVHEIWLGAKRESPLRERLVGISQYQSWRRLLKVAEPAQIDTQATPYQHLLQRLSGKPVGLVPLCGNVPVIPQPRRSPEAPFRAGFFGTLHEPWDETWLFDQLRAIGQQVGKPVEVMTAGRMGLDGERRWARWREQPPQGLRFVRWPGSEPTSISAYLWQLDLGLTTTPLALLEKSGTVAAMREHGRRIGVLRDDVTFAGVPAPVVDPRTTALPRGDWVAWWAESQEPTAGSRLGEVVARYQALLASTR